MMARSAKEAERYRVEPYVVAADVYAHPMHVGRGGWTWVSMLTSRAASLDASRFEAQVDTTCG